MDDSTLQKMLEFAAGADPELTKELFSLCNGVRVGATKFGVYGIIGAIDRSSSDSGYHPPLDINIPNIYGRPETWPENCLIVGFSYESSRGKTDQKMIHAITPNGKVIVAEERDFLAVDREYYSVEDWLSREVKRALDDVLRF